MKTTRIVTRIGDLFEVPLDDKIKKYFQFVAIDATQLNSSVIRVFKTAYPVEAQPRPDEIVRDEVDLYAHTVLKTGILQKLWKKVGKSADLGSLDVLFRGTDDTLNSQIRISENWHVWKISEPPRKVGKLEGENQMAEVGTVIPPQWIVDRIRTGKYNFVYPHF